VSVSPQVPEPLTKLPSPGELVGGKYRVEGTAGVGGMGVVLSARHEELGHQVAIKFLASEDDTTTGAVERFLREGKIVASLQSDHVVRIYDVGRLDSGTPYMVLELLRGRDLGAYVAAVGAVPAQQAIEWLLQASHAISEAHERGIIHRDLKPANLFLTTRSDGTDCVKVLDFGISKRITLQDSGQSGTSLTATRQIVGSPAYMSPEQVRNARTIDHRVDIWALGVTLYELLAGRTAFDADTFPAVCAAIVTDYPPSRRDLVPSISRELETIVMRCLEKDPAKRYPSVAALANDLRRISSPRTPSASRPQGLIESFPARSGEQPSTLISSTPEPIAREKSANISDSVAEFSARTMTSADVEEAAVPREHYKAKPTKRVGVLTWSLLSLFGFGLVASWKLAHLRPSGMSTPPRTLVTQAVTPMNDAFQVRIESVPGDADVWDDTKLLGRTPLTISINHAAVRAAAKQITVKKIGFEPFVTFQGDASRDVTITARLTERREPEALPTPPAPQPKRPPARPSNSAKPGAGSAQTAPPEGNDIRSKR
jgi:serine/threonine protein kinase